MDIHLLAERSFSHDPLRRSVGRLVETVGTPRFERQLFDLIDEVVRCEHFTAFVVSPLARPRLLLAANRGSGPIARNAANAYLGRHWDADPTNALLAERRDLTRGVVACVSAEEMSRLTYRRQCYSRSDWEASGSNLIHKMTIIRQRETDAIKVHLHRHRDTGPFSATDVERIAESSDLLFAFLSGHTPIDPCVSSATLRRRFQACLEESYGNITTREAQVCAAIAVGMTSEAIALTLGIGINTVLTYRKRAYARLDICSQNELLRLIYSKLPRC